MYEQFKSSKFDGQYLIYTIKSTAHQNIFNQIKLFTSKTVKFDDERINFEDEQHNYISIVPQHKLINVNFQRGRNSERRLRQLPSNYKMYTIRVDILTVTDMEVISDWRTAESIDIFCLNRPDDGVMALVNAAQTLQNIRFKTCA